MGTPLTRLAETPVTRLRGVGDRRAEDLGRLGIDTVLDLVTHYPRRHVDRTNQRAIAQLVVGQDALVVAVVRRVVSRRTRQRRTMVEVDLFDGSSYLHVTFFNQPWRERQLETGTNVAVWGKVEQRSGRRQMTNPTVDLVGDRTGRIVPVYPLSEKVPLTSDTISRLVEEALRRSPDIIDPLPAGQRALLDLPTRDWALRRIHLPESMDEAGRARRRLAFDELLRLQMILVLRKRAIESERSGIVHGDELGLVEAFLQRLPFPLTAAQVRAVGEIADDLGSAHPMHRLLQGDVGAGKTVVALAALLTGVGGGHQGALMAPTEVLAEQHYAGVRALVADLQVPAGEAQMFPDRPLSVALVTARTPAAERRKLHARLADGSIDIAIGTHALLTEAVVFADLGVVVIDEQHRFGVEQRSALRDKGDGTAAPDVLVMTATPIPRTAAMTVYGDLDTTVLDQLPPGRTPVTTHWARGDLEEAAAWARVVDEVGAGRQAYVVCPLIDGSERVVARSATEEYARLGAEVLPDVRLGLLHGQLPARDKESVMAEFRAGRIDVLVATTVIEVGVDVPTATVMVIEDADRFGIAQLHQLRGRVGRGHDASWCYLLGDTTTEDGAARLEALEAHTDGFLLAEIDLELRGEGTILGTRQKGATDLKLASLRRDRDLVEAARATAFALTDTDPTLAGSPDLAEEIRLLVDPDEADFLFKS